MAKLNQYVNSSIIDKKIPIEFVSNVQDNVFHSEVDIPSFSSIAEMSEYLNSINDIIFTHDEKELEYEQF